MTIVSTRFSGIVGGRTILTRSTVGTRDKVVDNVDLGIGESTRGLERQFD